jgi:glycosyltransferase involved in cell wall biosynthesis
MVFAALVPRLLGASVLLDVHDLMPELYMSKFGIGRDHRLIRAITAVERASVAFAHRAIAVHRTHLDALVSHGNPPERFDVLLNTPDPAIFVPRPPRRQTGAFTLVYHGTLSRRHGLELLLRATALARCRIDGLRLSIIGDGDDRERLVGLAGELGLDGTAGFTKASVPVNELPGLLADADLGVVPLARDAFTQYMLPVKLLEYVALGIPSIVTRTMTIEGYFDATMVEFIGGDSVEELARCIVDLHGDRARMARMAVAAGAFAARYHWDRQKLEYFRLVDSLVHRDAATPAAHRVP